MATKFRELSVGQTFDFVKPNSVFNSFFDRCIKVGPRAYASLVNHAEFGRSVAPIPFRGVSIYMIYKVGSINVEVFNVGQEVSTNG
jgi:hypothetical protein